MPDNSGSQNKKSVNKGLIAVIVVALVVIIALLAIIIVMLNRNETSTTEDEKRAVVVTEEKAETIAAEMISQEYVEPGYYETVMTTGWHFPAGDTASEDAYVENLQTNTNDVYFDLVLSDDESQIIYKSPVIPRGASLDNIKLDTDLDAGEYDCVMIYHLVDDNQNTVSELRVGLTIVVEN